MSSTFPPFSFLVLFYPINAKARIGEEVEHFHSDESIQWIDKYCHHLSRLL